MFIALILLAFAVGSVGYGLILVGSAMRNATVTVSHNEFVIKDYAALNEPRTDAAK